MFSGMLLVRHLKSTALACGPDFKLVLDISGRDGFGGDVRSGGDDF